MHSGIIVGCLITLGDKLEDTVDKQTYESVNLTRGRTQSTDMKSPEPDLQSLTP